MKIYILIFLGIIAILTAQAQKCGSSLNMQLIQKENPTLYNELLQIEYHTNDFIKNRYLKSATTTTNIIRIPVVVHVVYNTSDQNISDDQVLSQIEVLNEDFRRQNDDKSNTPSEFSSVASDPQIEFFLACIDPNGNITNGITRTQTTQAKFKWARNSDGTTNEISTRIKFASLGGHDAWPSNRYLNIWTCNLDDGLLGYAQFPGIGQANTDGVVIRYDCFGRRGTLNTTYNKGRTTTHEVGHWLNLIHIWGDDSDQNGICISSECAGNDNVTDTPNQGEENYGCPTFPKTDCCTTSSPGVMFMNYMDYTDDACMNLFTSGQTTRMRALFAAGGFRECFITNPIINNWCQSIINYSGPSIVCSSGAQFTVNVPGATVSWTCSTNLSFDNQTGNPKTFTANGNGTGTIQATIINGCGNVTLPVKDVWVGAPSTPTSIIPFWYNGMEFGSNSIYEFHVMEQLGVSNYQWSFGGATILDGQGTSRIRVETWDATGGDNINFTVGLRYENDCGSSSYFVRTGWVVPGTGGATRIVLSPNPSTSETMVSIESSSKEASRFDEAVEWDLEVYNQNQLLKTQKTGVRGKSATLNTTGWKDGVYIVRVKIGKEVISEKLVVKH